MRPEDYYDNPTKTDVNNDALSDYLQENALNKKGEHHVDD
jgi:hypothetical protein